MAARRPLLFLLALTAAASLMIGLDTHWSAPMPGYFDDAKVWAAIGHIDDTFTPLAYPLFLGPAFRLAGIDGIIALQIALQVGLAAVCYFLLRQLKLPSWWSAWGSIPVALHPDLLVSVVKIWDVPLSTFLLLLLLLLCLYIHAARETFPQWRTALLGLVLAAAVACRPNYILLILVAFFSFYRPRGPRPLGRACGYFAAALFVACAGFALIGLASHGRVFFPRNGPYNLYAGHNPHTAEALLNRLNAEPSISTVYLETHAHLVDSDLYAPALEPFYTHQAIVFAERHPGAELELIPLKLLTLFRPDTKVHPLLSRGGLAKGILALPVFLVLAALVLPGRPALEFEDWLLFGAEALYVFPFLVTNSDPRFRMPLDALLLLHFARLLYRRLQLAPAGQGWSTEDTVV